MASKRHALFALSLVALFAAASLMPMVSASHISRIVWPYGVDERHVPVIAGYKVVPDPLQCNHGTVGGNTLYQNDLSGGLGALALKAMDVGERHSLTTNQWHVTSFVGKGTDFGHSSGNRLYFGNDATGMFRWGSNPGILTQGIVTLNLPLPAGPTPYYIGIDTKWETEWLEGYDHMWIEAQPADGRIYILCTLNPEGRGDPSSSETQSLGSCSPYSDVAIPCPVSAKRLNNAGVPVFMLDQGAPHWEARFVQIPPIWNGQTVTLRLTFDSADGVSNTYLGWMADDIVVGDLPLPVPTALPIVSGLIGQPIG
ncbi:MAG TPA: hypothetical protein VGR28_05750 [Candidatus Thermoplasmatota archaeon]|nr:hypothetical protein [Candidatus Thermoplasmatota archaeon]